jgi:hypothetical protein
MSSVFLITYFLVFTFVASLALYFSKAHLLKFLLVGLLFYITGAIYFSFESYKGWPTSEDFTKVQVMWTDSVQPSKKGADDGAIYVWGYEVNDERKDIPWYTYSPPVRAPRAYVFPWTEEFEQKTKEAKEKIKGGSIVIMEESEQGVPGEEEGTEAKGGALSMGSAKEYKPPTLRIYAPQEAFSKD